MMVFLNPGGAINLACPALIYWTVAIIEIELYFAFLLFLMFFKDCMGRNLKDTLQSLCKARDSGMFFLLDFL
jgi:hypothetical protein